MTETPAATLPDDRIGPRDVDEVPTWQPEGLLDGIRAFAGRRPGLFLAAALTCGFVIGRIGKSFTNTSTESKREQS